MSTEHDKNKVTIDDEQFIAALYAELEMELESAQKNTQQNELTTNPTDKLFTEQPSASLDQRILAAAHKAVDSSPKVIDLAGEKSSISRKTSLGSSTYLRTFKVLSNLWMSDQRQLYFSGVLRHLKMLPKN